MIDPAERVIYQLKVVLLGISPMIWRRVKVSSNSTIEDLHYTIQLAMGWEDIHLHGCVAKTEEGGKVEFLFRRPLPLYDQIKPVQVAPL